MPRIFKISFVVSIFVVSIILVTILGIAPWNTGKENNSTLNDQTVDSVEHPKYCNQYCLSKDCTCGCHSSKRGHRSGKPCTCANELKKKTKN